MASSLSYEQQREQRIARNRLVLAELGLLNNPLCGTAQQKGIASGRKEPPSGAAQPKRRTAATEGMRKSRRLQQQEAELPEASVSTLETGGGSGRDRSYRRSVFWILPPWIFHTAGRTA